MLIYINKRNHSKVIEIGNENKIILGGKHIATERDLENWVLDNCDIYDKYFLCRRDLKIGEYRVIKKLPRRKEPIGEYVCDTYRHIHNVDSFRILLLMMLNLCSLEMALNGIGIKVIKTNEDGKEIKNSFGTAS